ncbi:MAG: TonB-dependent receptor, partial [Bacteroidales bacterium]|nr:TonB-dependent receptor [Bacteroidales bacterium]
NGSAIYNPNHMFGLFSAFDPDVVDEMELYKSSIPAEYGGRISSVLNVKSKSGDPQKIKAAAGIGVLTSHAYIEGPLAKDKTTFVLGGRTTYSNWILGRLPQDSGHSGGKANFSDISAGVTHRFSSDNSLQMNAYWSTDGFSFSGDTTFRYKNVNVALKWKKRLSARTSVETSGGYDWYAASIDDAFNPYDAYKFETVIRQVLAKSQLSTVLGKHTLFYGAQITPYALDRGNIRPIGDESNHENKTLGTELAFEPAVWVSDSWQMTDKLLVDYGTRLSSFLHTGPAKFYANPDIRLSGKYSFTPDFSLKAGFNTMSQYIHMISNTTSVSPMNTWKLSDDKLKPQSGWQAAAGAYLSVAKSLVDLSVETYYKRTYNYLDYKTGADLVMNENLADELITTKGQAYGVEFMVRKPVGKLNGWISYTYSRSLLKEMEDRGVMTINKGAWYPAAHDKPHDLKVVANYAITHRYSISANVDYSTGRPVTVPVGIYYFNGGYRLAYSDRNGHRIPDYFRLDLALNIEPGHYLKKLTHFSYTIGVYNVTGRKNAYSVFYATHDGTKVTGHMLSVFATQIPYININVRF